MIKRFSLWRKKRNKDLTEADFDRVISEWDKSKQLIKCSEEATLCRLLKKWDYNANVGSETNRIIDEMLSNRTISNRNIAESSFRRFIYIWEGSLRQEENDKLIDLFMKMYDGKFDNDNNETT